MSEWYSNLKPEEIQGKHVHARFENGSVIEGRLVFDRTGYCARLDEQPRNVTLTNGVVEEVPRPYLLFQSDDSTWHQVPGVMSVEQMWDERDWEQIDVDDLCDGDAVVANGRLYKVDVSWTRMNPPQVVTDTPSRMRIDLSLVSCALRRKVDIPLEAGFYRDRTGSYWVRAAEPAGDLPWWLVDPDDPDQPRKSDKSMVYLRPLTPVHFESGRAA